MSTRRIAPALAALVLLAAAPAWAQSSPSGSGANSTPPSTTTPPASTMPGGSAAGAATSTTASTAGKPWRASKLIGADVYGADDKKIGQIDDLLINDSGEMQAVISVGGFLGIGDRLVSVPYRELQHGERWMLPGANQDSLKSRPEFSYADNTRN